MDYEDYDQSFAAAPVRYALDDHDSDEENEACAQIEKVSVQTNLTIDSKDIENKKWTLIFGLNGPGNVYINSLEGITTTAIGTVDRLVNRLQYIYKSKTMINFNSNVYNQFEKEDPRTKANVFQIANQSVLLIPFLKEIQAEEAAPYTKSIFNAFNGNVEKVIVLDAFTATGYTSETWNEDMIPPSLRVLQTSSAPVIKSLPLFEIPNIIKALAASIVNYVNINYKRKLAYYKCH